MPLFLKNRKSGLSELMDSKDCDPELLDNTYKQFKLINLLLCNWRGIYKSLLRPVMNDPSKTYSLLDIGFGGGDIPVSISKWAKKDGLKLKITAIETDNRSFEFAQKLPEDSNIQFMHCSSSDLLNKGLQYDFVISNHLMHHLNDLTLLSLLNDARSLSTTMVLFNDIERSDLGYLMFTTIARLIFHKSYIVTDGLTSIKRSFTRKELRTLIPEKWTLKTPGLYRLLLIYEH